MKVKDPICGMSVDTDHPAAKGTYNGQMVYFCSEACKKAYDRRFAPA